MVASPSFCIVQGGEVFDRLVERVTFTEVETADLLVQLLCAVAFMHEQARTDMTNFSQGKLKGEV
jgi:hypothetical protein